MDNIIAVVGGGSTSISFIYKYIQLIDGGKILPKTIYLFEKRTVFGPGAAYETDLSSNILNTKTGFITPYDDRPGDFYKWLLENPDAWRERYPDSVLDEHGYAPRPLFGEYLERQMQWLVKEAAKRQIHIVQMRAEVRDIYRADRYCVVKTDCDVSVKVDHVFFFCGTLAAKRNESFDKSNRILATPYPVRELANRIPADASVGIAGARLSSIDAVVALVESGHKGKITIHSRSGYFPSVRGTQGRITPKYLTEENVKALASIKGCLRLGDIADLVCREISAIDGSTPQDGFAIPRPPANLADFLRAEIEAAKSDRVWQAVLYSTNKIIDLLWRLLAEEDRTVFLREYFTIFMAYRVSIPSGNARKILGYLESGQLDYCPGDFKTALDQDGMPVVHMGDGTTVCSYDHLINAIGSPRTVSQLNSALVGKLLQDGIMAPHHCGGIMVDPESYRLVAANGEISDRMRAVGELTNGTFLFTSALDINARHARLCATRFSEYLEVSRCSAMHFEKEGTRVAASA